MHKAAQAHHWNTLPVIEQNWNPAQLLIRLVLTTHTNKWPERIRSITLSGHKYYSLLALMFCYTQHTAFNQRMCYKTHKTTAMTTMIHCQQKEKQTWLRSWNCHKDTLKWLWDKSVKDSTEKGDQHVWEVVNTSTQMKGKLWKRWKEMLEQKKKERKNQPWYWRWKIIHCELVKLENKLSALNSDETSIV